MSEPVDKSRRSERINIRVEPEADQLLRAAANVLHKSLSGFMLDSALERAHQVMDDERRLVLQAEAFDQVLAQLDRPAQVVAPLVRLAERAARQTEPHRV